MVYDIETNTWTTLTARLTTARSDCCTAAVAGRLYTAGMPQPLSSHEGRKGWAASLPFMLTCSERPAQSRSVCQKPSSRQDLLCA